MALNHNLSSPYLSQDKTFDCLPVNILQSLRAVRNASTVLVAKYPSPLSPVRFFPCAVLRKKKKKTCLGFKGAPLLLKSRLGVRG